jgi:hypothetical protein
VLDKESFTLEELLEEDDVIQECKSLNSRLVNLCVPPAKPRSRPATRHARVPASRSSFVFARQLEPAVSECFVGSSRRPPRRRRVDRARRSARTA